MTDSTKPASKSPGSPQKPGVPRLSVEARAAADLEAARARAKAEAQASKRANRDGSGGGWHELPLEQKLRIAGVAGAVLLLLLGLALGSVPTKIVISVMCLGMLQGLWRGASELVGLVFASLVAVLLAPPLGRGLEGVTAGVLGTGGLLNRMISISAVGLIIVIVGTAGLSLLVKRMLKKHPEWVKWNSVAGGGLGLVEGVILGMAVLWVGLALEPIAASQTTDTSPSYVVKDESEKPSALATGVKTFAENVRQSALGGLAQATSPIEGSRLLTLANDFTLIARDEAALDFFVKTSVMQEIQSLPSVVQAQERLNSDAELMAILNDHGVSSDTLRALMESPTVLEIFDKTTVISDLTPKADALVAAIAEAKTKIGTDLPTLPSKFQTPPGGG